MKPRIAAATAALALTAGLLTTPNAGHASPILPAASPAGTYKADLDGDGKNDTLTITGVDNDGFSEMWQFAVVTAKGATSTTYWFAPLAVTDPFDAFASIDPVKGKEIVLVEADNAFTNGHELTTFVITWRHGTFLQEWAPWTSAGKAGTSGWWTWHTEHGLPAQKEGFRQYTSKHKRYSENFDLTYNSATKRWVGAIYRSVWKSGAWHDSKKWQAKLTNKQAAKYKELALVP